MESLNDNQLEVLRILWEHGELKPAQIQSNFNWEIENATLRSVLRGLVDAGQASRRKQGKAFFYRAHASRDVLMKKVLREAARVFTGGSAVSLIVQLVKSEKLSPTDVAELRRYVGKTSRKTSSSKDEI